MFGFRTLRFFTGALVLTLIATGNGETVVAGARTAVSLAEKTIGSLQSLAGTAAAEGDRAVVKAVRTGEQAAGRTTPRPAGRSARERDPQHTQDDHGSYSFTRHDDGQPVRWCAATIRVLLNERSAPAGAAADFRAALAEISRVSGIDLQVVGQTELIADRSSHLRGGDPYPEVLVGWALPGQSDLMLTGASGVTVANPARTDAGMRLVTGALVFNRDHDVLYRAGFGKGMTRGNLYLHELGHLLGLGHVDDDGELMATTIGPDTPAGLSAGDRAGLRAAGSC